MNRIFIMVFNMSIAAGWLILAVTLVRLILRKAPKWISCILWGLVALRLVCPLTLPSGLSLIPSAETVPVNITETETPAINSGLSMVDRTVDGVIDNIKAVYPSSANPVRTVVDIASVVWVIGFAVMMVYALIRVILLKKKVAASVPVTESVLACDDIYSPFVLGLIRPKIYVPSYIESSCLKYSLDHEYAHLKRKDHIWKLIGYLILAVHWFNPLCWLSYYLMCLDMEMACDEKVVRGKSSSDLTEYLNVLLSFRNRKKSVSVLALSIGEPGIKKRVKNIAKTKWKAAVIIPLAILSIAALTVFFMTNPFVSKKLQPDAWQPQIESESETDSDEKRTIDIRTKSVKVGWYGEPEKLFPNAFKWNNKYPIFVIESETEMQAFEHSLFGDSGCPYSIYVDDYSEMTAEYGSQFFNTKSLIAVYVESPSGMFQYKLADVTCEGNIVRLNIICTDQPVMHTDDLSGWLFFAELSKRNLALFSEFEAVISY